METNYSNHAGFNGRKVIMLDNEDKYQIRLMYFTLVCTIFLAVMLLICFSSCCTLSLSNVMTSGQADDVGDDTQSVKSDPVITPTLTIPVKP